MPVNSSQVSISRRNIIIAIVIFLALDVFAFFMGITVGRYGRKYQTAPLPQPVQQSSQPVVNSELDSDLAIFEEKETKERETPVEVDFLDEETLIGEEEPAEVQSEPVAPAAEPIIEAPKLDPSIPDASQLTEGYWIQVLAIGELNSAQRFRKQLLSAGYKATIIAESDLYKVQVGPFEERPAAAEARQQLNQKFQVEGWIRKR